MAAGVRVAQMGVLSPTLQKVVDPKYSAKVTFSWVLIKWKFFQAVGKMFFGARPQVQSEVLGAGNHQRIRGAALDPADLR